MAPRPWVIAHRGASGLRPEHTLEAYALAIDQGADFVEPDLVPTKDGVLVARHENELSRTTDISSRREWADRRSIRTMFGEIINGWFAEDFTLAELRTLRAREPMPDLRPGSATFDLQFGLVTLDEIISLVAERSRSSGRTIGIVAELKHAAYFDAIRLPLDELLLPILRSHAFDRQSPFFIEAFDPTVLQQLRAKSDVRLIQLEDRAATPHWLSQMARYADGIAAHKSLIVPRDEQGRTGTATALVHQAHDSGLLVFAWTFRSENLFLPAELRLGDSAEAHGDATAEIRQFAELGVDALFCDFPAEAVGALAPLSSGP